MVGSPSMPGPSQLKIKTGKASTITDLEIMAICAMFLA